MINIKNILLTQGLSTILSMHYLKCLKLPIRPFFSLLFQQVLPMLMKDFSLCLLSYIAQTVKQFMTFELRSSQQLLELNLSHFLEQAQNIDLFFFSFHLRMCFLLLFNYQAARQHFNFLGHFRIVISLNSLMSQFQIYSLYNLCHL